MKTMTCRQLGGPCDLAHEGDDANEIIKAQDQHLRDAVAAGDSRPRAGAEGHEGPLEAPGLGAEVVPPGAARLRRAARARRVCRGHDELAQR